jgi:hypothetical protein
MAVHPAASVRALTAVQFQPPAPLLLALIVA